MKNTLFFLLCIFCGCSVFSQSNNCDGAQFLTTTQLNCQTSGANIVGSTNGAGTQEGIDVPGCIDGKNKEGHWYRFIARGPDLEVLNAGTDTTHVMLFNDVCPPNASDLIYCDEININIVTGEGDNLLITGKSYLLWIGLKGDAGPYNLCITNPTPPVNDLCSNAQVISPGQLDCPDIFDPVLGHTTNASQQGLYFSNLDPLVELPCALDTTRDSGVWFRFMALGTDLIIEDNLGNNPTILLMRYEPCESDSIFEVFCEQTPIGSDFGEVGNNATVIGDEYLMYVTFQGGESEADTFELCIDNEGGCNTQGTFASSWCQTTRICGLSSIDGICYDMIDDNLPSEGFPGCANSLDNPNWLSFVAGANNMAIEIQVGDCMNGQGIQVGMYEILDAESLGPNQPFCSASDVGLGPLLTGCATISVPQGPGTVVTLTANTESGKTYALVFDGWGPDLCALEINVLSGGEPAILDSLVLEPPNWDDSVFPFIGDTVCTGTDNVIFALAQVNGICEARWTINGNLLEGDDLFSRIIDFPVSGSYQICASFENSFSSTDTVCTDVTAADFFPAVTIIDTSFSCAESLLINARNYSGFSQIQGIRFTLPDGQQVLTDTFHIIDTGVYVITANECSDTIILNIETTYSIEANAVHNDCYSSSLTITTQGLTNPKFLWSSGDTASFQDSLTFGWHSITINADNFMCDFTRAYFIDFPDSCKSTIAGVVNLQDTLDCDSNTLHIPIENQKIEITPIGIIASTDAAGFYAVELPPGIYQIKPILSPTQLESCPNLYVDTLTRNINTVINDFNIIDTTLCNLSLCLASGIIRPGRRVNFTVDIKNNSPINRPVVLHANLDDTYTLNSISSTIVPISSIFNGIVQWENIVIPAGATNRIRFSIELSPAAQLGSILSNLFYLDKCSPNKIFTQIVQASYDPNDKTLVNTLSRSDQNIFRSDSVLDYVIRFQNTGNDTAFFVQVADQLSENLDLHSFSPGASSHDYTWRILPDRTVEFTFDPILLPYESIDDEGSQGFVSFSIRPNEDFMPEDSILNKASIFFDFNVPVITNTVNVKYKRPQYIQSMYTAVCTGDTFFDVPIITDTIIEVVNSYFDFDSVYQYNLEVIDTEFFYVDTTVVSGAVFLGDTITNDTVIVVSFINPTNGCEYFIEYNISIGVGVNSVDAYGVSVSPNPFNNNLRFNAQEAFQKIELFDMNGKLIVVEDNIHSKEANVSTQTIHAGLYFAVITLPNKKLQVKLLKL